MTAPSALVVGGSVTGLAIAWALAERGFQVRVVERGGAPGEGPASWERPPVPQNRHSHTVTSLGVRALRRYAPALLGAVVDAGARLLDLTEAAPRGLRHTPADADLVALAVRRTTFERVLYHAVSRRPGVVVEHSQAIHALLVDSASGHVEGAITAHGERITAEVVVDASGRAMASRSWLAAAGLPPAPRRSAPTGLRVFTRFYRLADTDRPPGPLNRGNAAGGIWGHYAAVVHPAEDGTFAVSLGFLADDPCTRALLTPAVFTAVARLSPFVAPWAAPGVAEPISDLRTMVTPPNALYGVAAGPGGHPVTGLFPVGDAACVTDPLYGRGLSLALEHAFRLADLLHDGPRRDQARSEAAAQLAEDLFLPWYEHGAQDSGRRAADWRVAVSGGGDSAGAAVPALAPADESAVTARPSLAAIGAAAASDPQVWRGLTQVLMTLAPPAEVFDDPAFRARVMAAQGLAAPGAALRAPAALVSAGCTGLGPAPAGPAPAPPTRGVLLAAVATGSGGG